MDLEIDLDDAHHEDCDKRWRSFFDERITNEECPTCQALRDDKNVYPFEILEMMYAGRGWTYVEIDTSD